MGWVKFCEAKKFYDIAYKTYDSVSVMPSLTLIMSMPKNK